MSTRAAHDLDARPRDRDERLAAHVAELIAQAPPVTPKQRDRLAALLVRP